MSGPKHVTEEFHRQVKRSARLDHHKTWEDTDLFLEKAVHTHGTNKLYQDLKKSTGKKAAAW